MWLLELPHLIAVRNRQPNDHHFPEGSDYTMSENDNWYRQWTGREMSDATKKLLTEAGV